MRKVPQLDEKFLRNWNKYLYNKNLIHLLVIIAFILIIWEIFALQIYEVHDSAKLRYLYISRGIFGGIIMATYALWNMFLTKTDYEKKLARTEEYYKTIIDNSGFAIVSTDIDWKINFWNIGAKNLFGWTEEEIKGKSITILLPGDKEDIPDFLKTCKDNYYYETIYNGKDGKQISVGISKYAFYDDKNNIINRSQIIRDLTEHEILEKQMLQSEKLITIGHLAAGLAHEIGNPLTSISSLAQLTKRKSEDQIVIANLEKIIVNIKRISKIVRQMVDFSRPSKANANISDINEIIGSAVGIFHYDTRAKDTKIHMNLDSKIPDLWADPDQIHQIILNMLINAVDANEGTGQNVYIETYCYQDTINISIRDEGPGVPDAIKENIFEPFFTTKEVGKGTGLGLAVSHGIIRNLGGRIDIVDAEEGGAMFIIKLPKARKE